MSGGIVGIVSSISDALSIGGKGTGVTGSDSTFHSRTANGGGGGGAASVNGSPGGSGGGAGRGPRSGGTGSQGGNGGNAFNPRPGGWSAGGGGGAGGNSSNPTSGFWNLLFLSQDLLRLFVVVVQVVLAHLDLLIALVTRDLMDIVMDPMLLVLRHLLVLLTPLVVGVETSAKRIWTRCWRWWLSTNPLLLIAVLVVMALPISEFSEDILK